MRILTGLAGSLLVLTLAATGCGGDTGEESTDTSSAASGDQGDVATFDACTLLSPADVEATFGSSFDDGEPIHEEGTGADECVWKSTDGPEQLTFSITVVRQKGLGGSLESSGLTVEELFQQTKAAYPNAAAVNLGDEAYAAVSEVQVLEGETWYSFTAYLGAGVDPLDGLKELAARVVG